MTLAPQWPQSKLKQAGPNKKISATININKMDFLCSALAPTKSDIDITINSCIWDTNSLPLDYFNLTLSTLKQANSTIEDIYDSYYSPPIIDYGWIDISKGVTVGCNGWSNQQL